MSAEQFKKRQKRDKNCGTNKSGLFELFKARKALHFSPQIVSRIAGKADIISMPLNPYCGLAGLRPLKGSQTRNRFVNRFIQQALFGGHRTCRRTGQRAGHGTCHRAGHGTCHGTGDHARNAAHHRTRAVGGNPARNRARALCAGRYCRAYRRDNRDIQKFFHFSLFLFFSID